MSTVTVGSSRRAARAGTFSDRLAADPAYQAFWLLRIGFTVAPIVFGVDKFANVLVGWEKYLAPWIRDLSPLSAGGTMHVVGVIEIVAGVAVALEPRYGAYLVAAWLGGIIVNLTRAEFGTVCGPFSAQPRPAATR
jgi:uncharacterized membrane protein YphA (DoxX/SURF4 family)